MKIITERDLILNVVNRWYKEYQDEIEKGLRTGPIDKLSVFERRFDAKTHTAKAHQGVEDA